RWIKRERQRLGIQMHANEIFLIARAIRPPVNFLIFGMGNDSPFWFRLNHRGRTVFVEDQEEWFRKIHGENPLLEAYLVKYGTTLREAMQLIDYPGTLTNGPCSRDQKDRMGRDPDRRPRGIRR